VSHVSLTLCPIKQPRNIFKTFTLVEEKWVAVRMGGYRKTDGDRGIHSQDKGVRLFLNFVTCGHYLFYPLPTTPTYVISYL